MENFVFCAVYVSYFINFIEQKNCINKRINHITLNPVVPFKYKYFFEPRVKPHRTW